MGRVGPSGAEWGRVGLGGVGMHWDAIKQLQQDDGGRAGRAGQNRAGQNWLGLGGARAAQGRAGQGKAGPSGAWGEGGRLLAERAGQWGGVGHALGFNSITLRPGPG